MLRNGISKIVLLLLVLNVLGVFFAGLNFTSIRVLTDLIITPILFVFFFLFANHTSANLLKLILYLMFLVGLEGNAYNNYEVAMFRDIGTYAMIGSVLLINYVNPRKVSRITVFFLFLIFLYYIYSLRFMDSSLISSSTDSSRKEAFTFLEESSLGLVVYKTQTLLNPILYFFLLGSPLFARYINRNLHLVLIIFSILIILFYSLYYQKRQNLVELFLICSFLFFLYPSIMEGVIPKSRRVSISISLIVLFFLFGSNYFINVLERFSEGIDQGENFSRFREFDNVTSGWGFIHFIFGEGLGSFTNKAFSAGYNLHIGYFNFIFKGGFILFLYFVWNLFFNFYKCLKMVKSESIFLVGCGFSMLAIVSLAIAPGYGLFPGSFLMIGLGMFSRFLIPKFLNHTYIENN